MTGVQTCALPICNFKLNNINGEYSDIINIGNEIKVYIGVRSEERREGKECRCRWSPER